MFSFVIFDVDGTLVDSVDFHTEAWQRTLEKYGKKADRQIVHDQIGKGSDQFLPVFFSESEIKSFGEEISDYRGELFKREYLKRVKPLPKARDLVARLVGEGKSVALGSSAPADELEHYKELLDIGSLLSGETTADDTELSKPEPDIFAATLKILGDPPPNKTIVVGDAPYDAIAARKIGLEVIGLLSGGFPEDWLRREGCRETYRDPADLLERYGASWLARRAQI